MDILNKTYAQFADLFRSMTPGARITAGLLLTVVVVSIGYLFNNQISGPSADLLHGVRVSESQLDLMMAAFGKANLNDAVRKDGSIYVPHGMDAKYMGALADAKALPPNFGSAIKGAVESNNIFAAPEDRLNRMIAAKQEELRNVITSMPGIHNAQVLIDSKTLPGFKQEKDVRASIYVQPIGSQDLDEEKASAIRLYVKSSVAGLKYENVMVSDQNGHTFSGDPEHGSSAGDNKLVALQKEHEKILKEKIRNSLSYIPGVTIATTVTLDPSQTTRTTEIKHEKALEIKSLDSSTTRTADTGGTGGQPGFAAQQPNQAMALGNKPTGGSKEEENSQKTESQSIPSGKQTEIVKDGYTPTLETASIGIPAGYFKKIWLAKNPPAAGQEQKEPDAAALEPIRTDIIQKVKSQVARLLMQPEGNTDPLSLVAVTDFPEIPTVLTSEPSLAKNAMLWLSDYWSVAGMIGLVGASLLMLRSMIKSAPPIESNSALRLADTPDNANEESSNKPAPTHARRFTAGPSLRDEISTLVQEDPETAANILKSWIGHPA
jgi:flagellar M-ring protein FliF